MFTDVDVLVFWPVFCSVVRSVFANTGRGYSTIHSQKHPWSSEPCFNCWLLPELCVLGSARCLYNLFISCPHNASLSI